VGLRSTQQRFFSTPVVDPLQFLSQGQSISFGFQAMGYLNISALLRICAFVNSTNGFVCKNYTKTGTYIEGNFQEIFTENPTLSTCDFSTPLTLEFLSLSPPTAIIVMCSATDYYFGSYCGSDLASQNQISNSESFFDFPINYAAARVQGGTVFNVSFMISNGSRPDNSPVEVGFCGQSWRNRKLPISYSGCWAAGTSEKCETMPSHDVDFFSGSFVFNYSVGSNNEYGLSINGAQGLYLAAIGERPGIDVICNQN